MVLIVSVVHGICMEKVHSAFKNNWELKNEIISGKGLKQINGITRDPMG